MGPSPRAGCVSDQQRPNVLLLPRIDVSWLGVPTHFSKQTGWLKPESRVFAKSFPLFEKSTALGTTSNLDSVFNLAATIGCGESRTSSPHSNGDWRTEGQLTMVWVMGKIPVV